MLEYSATNFGANKADNDRELLDGEFFDGERSAAQLKPVSDEQWTALAHNDAAYDGQFFYAVKTTKIFCRPSCKSKLPNRDNICMFGTAEQALAASFRPCKRCKPTGKRLPDEEWVELITTYIDAHYNETLTLELLAQLSHGSPYHLHRVFKKVTGITPADYIQQTRISHARQLLDNSKLSVAEIGAAVGLANIPYFITLFKKKTGQTPESYRKKGRD